ncbi:helix-turn-helix domain-containing protein [Halorientalis salina]|uniref:helix-turn-helix domain-containing protein n=1 Tax=Halorientalis salina TaxID=2932266 RepID=UPI0010ACD885|nr:helix-turn-helix domain-containing protein [Halorientalis salina]
MSVIASVRLDGSDFALGRAFRAVPDTTVRVESIVPIASAVMPYFWIEATEIEGVTRVLRDADSIEAVTVIDEMDTKQLLKVQWAEEPDELVSILLDTEAIVLQAAMSDADWTFRLRFPDYDDLSAFSRRCREHDVRIELEQLYSPNRSTQESQYDLTPEQREVLVTAVEHGYFEVPRGVTLDELGDLLGISDSAASQRLRRGLATLLDSTLLDSQDLMK